MIEVAGLVKRYGRVVAVDGIDLTARPGQVLALLGANGAGKSTTIKTITGLIRPSAGRVLVAGADVVRDPVAAKARIGYVPDRPYLYPKLTGRELLRFLGRLRGVRDAEGRASSWLERFDLTHVQNERIETYSHGMHRAAPTRGLVTAKFLQALPPMLFLGVAIGGGAAWLLDLSPALAAASPLAGAAALVACGLGVGLGAAWPRFDATNPAEVPLSPGGLVYMGAGLTYALAQTVVLAWPGWQVLRAPGEAVWTTPAGRLSLLLALILTLAATILPLVYGTRRLARFEPGD